jgi:hypothetical protein
MSDPKPGPHTQKARSRRRKREEDAHRKQIAEERKMCENCGERPAVDVAHLKAKKMGGTWNPEILGIDNKRAWCAVCHGLDHGITVVEY